MPSPTLLGGGEGDRKIMLLELWRGEVRAAPTLVLPCHYPEMGRCLTLLILNPLSLPPRRRRHSISLRVSDRNPLPDTLVDCYKGAGESKGAGSRLDIRSGQGPRQMARKRKRIGNIENSIRPISIEMIGESRGLRIGSILAPLSPAFRNSFFASRFSEKLV